MLYEMTSRERFINALEMKEVDRVPYGYLWFGAGNTVLNRMGVSFRDVYYSPRGIARAQILAREMYHHDNVMVPWGCLFTEAEALGTRVHIKENGYPKVERYALDCAGDYWALNPRSLECSDRTVDLVEAIEILKKEIGDEAFITGAMLSPLMLAGQVLGVSRLCVEMLKNEEDVHFLLDVLTECSTLFADILLEAGVDGILVDNGESAADLFSRQMAEEFMLPYTKELYTHIKANDGYVISHNCAAHAFLDLELALEPDALNFAFGEVAALGKPYGSECKRLHRHKCIGCSSRCCFKGLRDFTDSGICLMGNINPAVFAPGSAADIGLEVKSCLEAAPSRGFILSTGCEIPLNAPSEKMDALWNAFNSRLPGLPGVSPSGYYENVKNSVMLSP
ncbi:uroporphyrinogen decarboxylase family protein [Methanosarcina sp. Mfa9]|uniref:uroporphyrinogen decarboxylase family protein n=1 Tax=Methanosarcina sp. Mfa9 TaxID=3439063 RepID=UPI003F831321